MSMVKGQARGYEAAMAMGVDLALRACSAGLTVDEAKQYCHDVVPGLAGHLAQMNFGGRNAAQITAKLSGVGAGAHKALPPARPVKLLK
ncbi:hypothetical protein D3093_33960 (plasmid) [Azospirillum argentinense]|uniref:Uncharacterized protein n=1 Tax=Azospirillum argentinense TaxID=2970906 RepID=A0A4D8PXT1_9PROT|nr:hypothetical protein [Azospirillum argentinense]QCO00246.1 hypothetical protein D3093_33960 [Azospirillum argentinense]